MSDVPHAYCSIVVPPATWRLTYRLDVARYSKEHSGNDAVFVSDGIPHPNRLKLAYTEEAGTEPGNARHIQLKKKRHDFLWKLNEILVNEGVGRTTQSPTHTNDNNTMPRHRHRRIVFVVNIPFYLLLRDGGAY